MNLYRILVIHASPKDTHSSIECYMIAENDLEVFHWVDKELAYGSWTEDYNNEEMLNIYDEEYNIIGQELYKDKMLRLHGEYFDPDASFDDAFYGVTHYGWELLDEDIRAEDIKFLKKFKMIK